MNLQSRARGAKRTRLFETASVRAGIQTAENTSTESFINAIFILYHDHGSVERTAFSVEKYIENGSSPIPTTRRAFRIRFELRPRDPVPADG